MGGRVRGLGDDVAALEDRGGDRIATARLGDVDLGAGGLGEADDFQPFRPLWTREESVPPAAGMTKWSGALQPSSSTTSKAIVFAPSA